MDITFKFACFVFFKVPKLNRISCAVKKLVGQGDYVVRVASDRVSVVLSPHTADISITLRRPLLPRRITMSACSHAEGFCQKRQQCGIGLVVDSRCRDANFQCVAMQAADLAGGGTWLGVYGQCDALACGIV